MSPLLLALALCQGPDVDKAALIKTMAALNEFAKTLIGCPKGAVPSTLACEPSHGTFDMKKWKESREAAKKLFNLEEPKAHRPRKM